MSASQYHYVCLASSEIRILVLLPGEQRATIHCSLERAHIEDPSISYIALSWCWGLPTKKRRTISIDGKFHSIWPSLHEALLAIRSKAEPVRLWVDALCINQDDVAEKEAQLPLMASIYSKAAVVLIWLGVAAGDSDYLFETIARCQVDAISLREKARTIDELLDMILEIGAPEYTTERFSNAICRLRRDRAWFRRVWVQQEFALNKTPPLVQCGNAPRILWTLLVSAEVVHDLFWTTHAMSLRAGKADRTADMTKGIGPWQGIVSDVPSVMRENLTDVSSIMYMQARRNLIQQSQLGPFVVVHWLASLQSTDPRDRVYGVLGLLSDSEREEFRYHYGISYRKPLSEVYRDFACYLVTNRQRENHPYPGLQIYYMFKIPSSLKPAWPSWTPDFRRPVQSTKMNWFREPHTATSSLASIPQLTMSHDRQFLATHCLFIKPVATKATFAELPLEKFGAKRRCSLWQFLRYLWLSAQVVLKSNSWRYLYYLPRGARAAFDHLAFIQRLAQVDNALQRDGLGTGLDRLLELGIELNETDMQRFEHIDESQFYTEYRDLVLFGARAKSVAEDAMIAANCHFLGTVIEKLGVWLSHHCFFHSEEKDVYGLASDHVADDDELALLFPPYYLPFIVRRVDDGRKIRLVCPAKIPESLWEDAMTRFAHDAREVDVV